MSKDTDISIFNGNDFFITSNFGEPHPFTVTHKGVDIVSQSGKDWTIEAVIDGEVVWVGDRMGANGRPIGYGNMVVIKNVDDTLHRYLHLEKSLVKVGQKVKTLEPVGIIGNTGNSFGRHLHLEVTPAFGGLHWRIDCNIDPIPYLNKLDDAWKAIGNKPHKPAEIKKLDLKPEIKAPIQVNDFIQNINKDELTMSQKAELETLIKSTRDEINKRIDETNKRFDGFTSRIEAVEKKTDEAKQKADYSITTIQEIADKAEIAINENRTAVNQQIGEVNEVEQKTNLMQEELKEAEKTRIQKLKDKPNWITTNLPIVGGGGAVLGGMGLDVGDLDKALPFLSKISFRQVMIIFGVAVVIIGILLYQNKDKILNQQK